MAFFRLTRPSLPGPAVTEDVEGGAAENVGPVPEDAAGEDAVLSSESLSESDVHPVSATAAVTAIAAAKETMPDGRAAEESDVRNRKGEAFP